MDIRALSLATAMRSDELVTHLHRLRHPSGWFGSLMEYLAPASRAHILVLLASVGGHPVGVMMVDTADPSSKACGVFVEESYRRRGIGSALMREAYVLAGPGLRCCPGDDGSMSFFEKLKPTLGLYISNFAMPRAAS